VPNGESSSRKEDTTETTRSRWFNKRRFWLIGLVGLCAVVCAIIIARYIAPVPTAGPSQPTAGPSQPTAGPSGLKAYDDVRAFAAMRTKVDVSNMDLINAGEIIPTLWFNEKTKWPAKMPKGCDPRAVLEAAKNPGLGVRALHAQGITGKGVAVAIIDQPLYQDHPEFKGKIAMYKDFECKSESSMHGPAVTSLLVGESCGAAPGARVYYAAAPSWLADAKYYADALDWIVSVNKDLPEGEGIRVVSVSAAPSGPGSPFTKNGDLWDKAVANAEKEGILVLDCTAHHGIILRCWYDVADPENVKRCVPGYPGMQPSGKAPDHIYVPSSPRTTAEEYEKGDCSYQYTGRGGLSWSIPYAAGVLALGWQVDPDLAAEEAVDLLFESAYKYDADTKIIEPAAFVSLVRDRGGS